ncbi:MAG: glucose-1-phosphate adenylyltransferase [Bacteroidetes bacterium]|nr:glucose-1-phosphate adenylyltransferase [Bacteroidota bacterium]MCH8524069.1 glucose-1-phosphate adenylyltransferase [Balneolales bacterium]
MMDKTIAVILGGGAGSRLFPLTKSRSKPAVPIGGKYRLVDIPISNCLHSDVRQIYVLTQFNSASLNRHIKNTYHFDTFNRKGFVDILAAEQTPNSQQWYQGTADAVWQSLHHMENNTYDNVLILSGDQLYQMDYKIMMEKHVSSGADLSIATIPVNADDATGFGIMKTDSDGTIPSFIEKPNKDELGEWESEVPENLKNEGRVYLASMGIYIFSRKALLELYERFKDAKDFGKEIIPAALKEYKVISHMYDGYWTDIGTIKSFFEANLELTTELPQFDLYDESRQIFTRARLLPASKLSGTTLEKTIVAEGGIIEASRIERAVIGIRSRIGKGTTVANSIVMGNDYYPSFEQLKTQNGIPPVGIGQRCYINNAIVDKNARIGNDVRINGGSHLKDGHFDNYSVVDGIVIVTKSSVIKDGTVI